MEKLFNVSLFKRQLLGTKCMSTGYNMVAQMSFECVGAKFNHGSKVTQPRGFLGVR